MDELHDDSVNFSLPSRLIDCDILRLIDTDTLPRKPDGTGPPYCALSHCWERILSWFLGSRGEIWKL
jgi:hypothetical protein